MDSTSPQHTPQGSNILGGSTQELYDSGSFQNEAYIFDPGYFKPCGFISGIKLKAQAEFGLSDHSAVLFEDNMYIYGGVSVDNHLLPTIQVFNFASRCFTSIVPATSPIPRYQHTAVVSGGQMIVFGGGAETGILNDIVSYSFETQTWSEITPASDVRPSARRGHTATLVGKVMYVFGGTGNNGPLNDMYKFDIEQKIWSVVETKGTEPQVRFLQTACLHKKAIWFFGGTNGEFVFGDLFRFDCESNTWEEISSAATSPAPPPRCSHTAVVSHDSMVVIGGGGASDNDTHIDAYEYNLETRKWYRLDLSTTGVSRQGHISVLRGESVFLFGGAAHAQLDLLALNKDGFIEDDIFQEAVQDDEVARQQALPRPLWEAMLLKKHPEILQYRELTRKLTGVNSYGRARNSASTEDPAHINHEMVLNLVVECLHSMGCSRSANAIVEESKVPYVPLTTQQESRLVAILKMLKPRTKMKNIFDAEFALTAAHVPDPVDSEVELVDHMVGAGRLDSLDNEDDIDIWLEPEDSRKNILRITENNKSIIRAANVNKLVQVLTYDREKVDALYMKVFFYTYQSFTSPEMLLKKLIQKYHVRVEKGVTVDDKFKAEVIEPVQTRVCRVLKFWIEQCPWDFNGPTAEKLLNSLNAFIDGPLSRDDNRLLVKQLRNSISKTMKKKHPADDDKARLNPPEPKTPRNVFSSSLVLKDVDEVEIARQLTLLEFHVFASITPNEFLNKGWLDQNPKKSPRLKEFRTRAIDVGRWVALTILKPDSKKESDLKRTRSKFLERFIRVADQLRQIKNYQTMNSVIQGYSHPSIAQLSQTFNEMSPRAKELYYELIQFAKNEQTHRDVLKNVPVPCIPHMEHALADLANLHDANPDQISNLINFQKRTLIYHQVTKFQEFQQRPFNFLPVLQITSLLKYTKLNDKDLEDMSRKCE